MFDSLKSKFPYLYDLYTHQIRRKKIGRIKHIKRLPFDKQLKFWEKTYEKRTGKKLDWNNLQTHGEKMQWEKIYNQYPLKVKLADKYAVRDWVREKIGEEYLIPLLGVYRSFDEIDFESLPDQFVMKANHGSGMNYIVKDKNKFNKKRAKLFFDDWMATDYGYDAGELHYSKIEKRIIIEEYLVTEAGELPDYKFLCFDGKPLFCRLDMGRHSSNHTRSVYDASWNLQEWNQGHYSNCGVVEKPINYEKMLQIAAILSDGFPHVRVDLYSVNNKIYFGEMTFTSSSGYKPNVPESADLMLGNLWNIGKRNTDAIEGVVSHKIETGLGCENKA